MFLGGSEHSPKRKLFFFQHYEGTFKMNYLVFSTNIGANIRFFRFLGLFKKESVLWAKMKNSRIWGKVAELTIKHCNLRLCLAQFGPG